MFESYLDMDLLRISTAGSVDDGKSTLIGRLLYGTKSIFEDQLDAIEKSSRQRGDDYLNLALLTDGLRAEREQGITIDVGYRYFATPRRKFIIADTPGHIQYTRNMVTGASTANLAMILIDARKGVLEQTKRHAFIASLLRIPHLVVCINKMDLMDYSKSVFQSIRLDFENFSAPLDIHDIAYIPLSALKGDNVVNRSQSMPWYTGSTLLNHLEQLHIASDYNYSEPRFPVQYVIRPQSETHIDYRAYAGRVAGGVFRAGDEVMALPSGQMSSIEHIDFLDSQLEAAVPGQSVAFRLKNELDISRGDMLVSPSALPLAGKEIDAMVCWFSEKPMQLNGRYGLLHTTRSARCMVRDIRYKVDIQSMERKTDDKNIAMNDIARIRIQTGETLFYDFYKNNRTTGSFILIDEATNATVGACMIEEPGRVASNDPEYSI